MAKKLTLLIILMTLMLIFASPVIAAVPVNLVTNGDFEADNTGFLSDYNYLDPANTGVWTMGPEYQYTVSTDPYLYHAWWASYNDHTSGDGNMMIVNANPDDPTQSVWESGNITLPEGDLICTSILYAGQNMEVGQVIVEENDGEVCVTFLLNDDAIDEGWLITETHVAVADGLAGIPQKNGNPIPGQFPMGETFDLGVTEAGPYCFTIGADWTDPYVVAAHAVIQRQECELIVAADDDTVVSSTATQVTDGNVPLAMYPHNAALMVPGTYPPNTWINGTSSNVWAPTASWIWESNPVVNPIAGDIVWFKQTFNIAGVPDDADLQIAVDNGYAVWLNGHFIGADNLFGFSGADNIYPADSVFGDLKQAYVDTTNWQDVGTFNNLGAYLVQGQNVLKILAVNEYMNTDDYNNPVGTSGNNPGGVVFRLDYSWDDLYECTTYKETAWGGDEDFPGKNWANYIIPDFECVNNFEFSFWAANSHADAPANLEIMINGDSVGFADLAEITDPVTGQWVQYTFDWEGGDADTANIKIYDRFNIAYGDDFSLDDISFIQVP